MSMLDVGPFRWARGRLPKDERGFTIIETVMALGILVIVMLSTAYTATIGFKYAGVARQRETAGGYAMKYYQQALALPFDAFKKGLNSTLDTTWASDVSPAGNIITSPATCAANGANSPCMKVPGLNTYESLQKTDGATGNPCDGSFSPMCPHVQTDSPPSGSSGSGTTYTSKVYVTNPPVSVCTPLCYRVIVMNSWNRPVSAGAASTITYQSLMTFTGGSGACLGTSSHPFAGPCGKYLYGQALIPQGSITITANTAGGTSIQNINLGNAMVLLPQDSTNSQSSQVSVVQGVTTTSGVSLGLGTAAPTAVGGRYISAQADNDPTLPSNPSQTQDLTGTDTSGSVSAQSGSSSTGTISAVNCGTTSVNAICLTKAITDLTASTTAAVAASSSPSCNGVTNGLPCGYSVSQVRSSTGCPGGMSGCVVLHLFNGATDLGTCTLVSVGAPPGASYTQVSQNTTTTPQPQTAKVSRSFGQVTFGCIPSGVGTAPSNWNVLPTGFTSVGTTNTGFLVAVKNGYAQTLQAQAGIASPATSATASGTEWYYSPGVTPQTGGTLSARLNNTTDSWESGGTAPSKIPPAVAGAGTLAAALATTTDTYSSLGTLSGAITNTATSIKVSETATPPATPFVIKIDSEQMQVTRRQTNGSGCSTSIPCYTVARGYNGTTAAAHSDGTAVSLLVTPRCPSPCTFNVNETVSPSSAVPFTIQVDSEQMQVTSRTLVSGSTYQYTATRGYNSTTPAAHSSGAAVSEVVTTCPTTCSFNVTETSSPPSSVPFTILVDGEQMQVTTRTLVSGSTYTYKVTRGYNSTATAAHAAGSTFSYRFPACTTTCSFNVTETSSPPSSVPFTIVVDSEQMQVTSRTLVSGSTYTYGVTRAYNGTTASMHTAGTTFYYRIPFGYTTVTDSSPSSTAMPVTSVNYTTGGCTYQESVSGSLTSPTGSVANTSSGGVVTNSAGTLTPPLKGDFKFNVTCGATVVADLDIAFNLGTMKATATYGAPAQ